MRLSKEAIASLHEALRRSGLSDALDVSSDADVEELGRFLLNLLAASVKTRERMRLMGNELPASDFPPDDAVAPIQAPLPGLFD